MDELEQLRLQIDAARQARAEKLAAALKAVELRRLQEEAKLEGLEEQHGLVGQDLAVAYSARTGAMVVCKRPGPLAWQRLADATLKDTVSSLDQEMVVKDCLVYPTRAELGTLLQDDPPVLGRAFLALITVVQGFETQLKKG